MNIELTTKEQIWQEESTRYWFNVDGEEYAINDNCGDLTLLDHEGYPIEECNDHKNIMAALLPHYQSNV